MQRSSTLFGIAALATLGAGAVQAQTLTSELVASGLSRPVALAHAGDPERAYIVQQRGLIMILDLTSDTVLTAPFADLSGLVSPSGNERGLLGLAFHPQFADNGLFYVNYTSRANGNTYIVEFGTFNRDLANPGSARQLMTYVQPFSNHNGGWIGFGPDGYLYIASGDGGSGNDPGGRGQDITDQPLGKMLRIDVNGDDFPTDDERNYAIPPSNPFVDATGDDEIWAYGLRNPWRNSFDRDTGDLWIADVGQNAWEELNFQPAASAGGENYGWRCMEGFHCTGLSGCTCDAPELEMPIHEYNHAQGCSITGGYVYRGAMAPHARGTYFFSDYCSATMWSLRYDGTNVTEFADRTAELDPDGAPSIDTVVSFGEDPRGEIYVCDLGGELFRIIPRCRVDLNGDGAVNTLDVLQFLNLWGALDPAADFNNDGAVNTLDVLQFLNDWNAGC